MIVHKEQLPALAEGIIAYAKAHLHDSRATVFALTGDLGAGKTTLVQHIARALGVEGVVPSPTFVIMKLYPTTDAVFTRLVHIDAYRIENEKELAPLRLEEIFTDPKTLVCIEWPEKLQHVLPEWAVSLMLAPISEDERGLSVDGPVEAFLESLR